MKKRLTRGTLFAALLVCLTLVLSACESTKGYVVYETQPSIMVDTSDKMKYYQVVIYEEHGDDDETSIIKHKNDLLIGMADEIHLQKSAFSEDEAKEIADSFYEDVDFDSMKFASKSMTDEGDYYCLLYQFEDLGMADNVKALVDAGILTKTDSDDSAGRVSAGSIMQSIAFSLGTTELSEEEVAKLDLHFKK